jgi:hypothetical protein
MSMARLSAGRSSMAGLSPRAVLGGAVVLVVLLVALTITAVSALSAPDAPDPVTMAPALAPAPAVQQPVRVGASRPVGPRAAVRAPASRPTPKRSSVEGAAGKAGTGRDATGKAYENGMDMARHAAGGGPWSGFIP